MNHEAQRAIVLKLIHNPMLSFNELWNHQGESNAFAYHLNKLESDGLVSKVDDKYALTAEGRKLSAFIEGDTGSKADFPTLTVFQLVKQGNKILCQKRLKEPFYGVWGFVAGKVNFGWNFAECAKRDLKEEADLEAGPYIIKGIEQVKTFENGKLMYHHILVCVETENPKGVLKVRTHKAENAWMTPEEYYQQVCFPTVWPLDEMLASKRFTMIEAERYMENGKFTDVKIVSKTEL